MSRNFYALAATLLLLSLFSCGMTFVPSSFQPELPTNASLWKTLSTFLLLIALIFALIGSMSHLFEQVDRRTEERRRAEREHRRKKP
jgi:cell division protein FtsX